MTESARAAGLDVEVDLAVAQADVPAPIATATFRIVQEAVTNVLRHAAARRVSVTVRREGGRVRLRVADDGIGVGRAREGRGLTGMRERAEALGGTLTVGSGDDGRGCVVEAGLPTGDRP